MNGMLRCSFCLGVEPGFILKNTKPASVRPSFPHYSSTGSLVQIDRYVWKQAIERLTVGRQVIPSHRQGQGGGVTLHYTVLLNRRPKLNRHKLLYS